MYSLRASHRILSPQYLAGIKMENTQTRRHQAAGIPRSPHLLRSRSGNTAVSLPELNAFTVNRSKSTTKLRINKEEENVKPLITVASIQKKPKEKKESTYNVKLMQRSPRNLSTTMRTRSVSCTSPSAWALSPGRYSACSPMLAESPNRGDQVRVKSGGGGAVSGVLKYFRKKKVSPMQEEEFHRFRVWHNRLLQWRFANARAQAAMAAAKIATEDKIFSVWLKILKMRNFIVEKRIQMQTLKQKIKLFQIIKPEICLLNEWTKLERRNYEAVGKLARKLSALLIRLPLVQGAEADAVSVYEAMSTAMGVMDGIEAMITKFFLQVEKICYMLTELTIIVKQENECLEELKKRIVVVALLEAREKSLRVNVIQQAKESRRGQDD